MQSLKAVLIVFWIALTGITIYAILSLGSESGVVFFTDLSHPWRAQFNTDFLMHIILFAIWVFYREESKVVGLIAALLSLLGGLFTFLYLVVAVYRSNGDVKKLLLGKHA